MLKLFRDESALFPYHNLLMPKTVSAFLKAMSMMVWLVVKIVLREIMKTISKPYRVERILPRLED